MKHATCSVFLRLTAATALMALLLSVTESAQSQQTPPPAGAPRSPVLPQPVEKTLKNGLRVIAVERSGVPLVSATVVIRSGAEADPAQLWGLAAMTGSLLTEGTRSRTAPQIAEAVEALGGSIESGAAWDASTAGIHVMSSKIEPALEILADVVLLPAFSEEEIERQRQQTLDQMQITLKQPGTLARLAAARLLYGDTPYGHPLAGTPESVRRIRREDIVRLHAAFYRPDNAIVVLAGDIRPRSALELSERLFGGWEKPQQPPPAPGFGSKGAPSPGRRVLVIDKADAGQAAVVLTRPGLQRADPGYFTALVANSVLGGGYSARLNQEIRIKRGLSYGASSYLEARRDVGPFVAAVQTKNESGAEVASLLASQLESLASQPIPEAELAPRKAALIGSFGRSLETTGGLAGQFASLALYGLPLNEITRTIDKVQAVTASEVQQFVRSRLAAAEASIVIVGQAQRFLPELRKRFGKVEVIAEAELDLNSADLRKTFR
ncbi:MAG: insulinase family protein [Acidobacteria bacterium]|nr:insulinase family protein [Acidobacteriota bacterium]